MFFGTQPGRKWLDIRTAAPHNTVSFSEAEFQAMPGVPLLALVNTI